MKRILMNMKNMFKRHLNSNNLKLQIYQNNNTKNRLMRYLINSNFKLLTCQRSIYKKNKKNLEFNNMNNLKNKTDQIQLK